MVIELETMQEAIDCLKAVANLFVEMGYHAKADDEPEELSICGLYDHRIKLIIDDIKKDYSLENE